MKMARIEAAVRVVLRYAQALERRDEVALAALLDSACRFEDPWGQTHIGYEAQLTFWRDLWSRAPHLHLELEQVYNLGLRCVTCWALHGLPEASGPLRGVSVVLVEQERIRDLVSYVQIPALKFGGNSTETAVVVK